MNQHTLPILLLFVLLMAGPMLRGQNLETIGKEKPLRISGGVSLNQIFYGVHGIESRRDPYSLFASGNLNLSIYGWNVPLSFSYSNHQTSFRQPFNQYSIHPTYKSLTGHFGYTSMSYSPYTVNGHIFLGGGIDFTPEGSKWRLSGLYGRFMKAIEPDSLNQNVTPAFQRMGTGFKAGYVTEKSTLDLILFHAKDDVNSISYVPEDEGVLPEENLVMSIGASRTFLQHFRTKAEIATSALSRDVHAEKSEYNHLLARAGFPSRTSTSYYNAFKTSMDYMLDSYSFGVGYERIAPQYRTLGSYYFNNDLENITVNGTASLAQGKMNIAANAGTQRDNLDKSKISTMKRLVGALNVQFTASENWNMSVSYSNFQTFTNIRSQFVDINQLTPYDNLDTLNFTQVSQNATLNTMYMFGKNKDRKQNLNFNFTFQDAADRQAQVAQNTGMQFYNLNTSYGINLVPQAMVISAAFNANVNQGNAFETKTLGPTASISKSLLDKKLRTTLSASHNSTFTNNERVNAILTIRAGGSYTVQKKHNLNISMAVVNRDSKSETVAQSFTEFTGTVGYSYSFNSQ